MHHTFGILLVLISILVTCSVLSKKLKLSLPILLLIVGIVISLFSNRAFFSLRPELIFLLFLPPLLNESALNISWREFKKWKAYIFWLSIPLVFFTMLCVAIITHYLIPNLSWTLCFLFGAIIAPPDAIAAASSTKGLNLPPNITAIIEGESLVNDASSLFAYQYVLALLMGSTYSLHSMLGTFAWLSGGGTVLGIIVAYIACKLIRKINDSTLIISLSVLIPLVVFYVAEAIQVSGVLAVVAYGLYISWHYSKITSFEVRMMGKSFWKILVFLLNGLVFLLIALQMPDIVRGFTNKEMCYLVGYGLITCAVIIISRLVFVMLFGTIRIFVKHRFLHTKRPLDRITYSHLCIVGCTGMRGVVSMAAAMAIPISFNNGTPFPFRHEILLMTFVVILFTLIVNSLILPVIIKKLKPSVLPEYALDTKERLRQELFSQTESYIYTLSDKYPNELIESLAQEYSFMGKNMSSHDNLNEKSLPRLELEQTVLDFQYQILQKLYTRKQYNHHLLREEERNLDIFNSSLKTKFNYLR